MRIEIDQSGKIEKTNRQTVIAFSNSASGVITISAKDKKVLQNFFRKINKPKLFVYLTFVTGVYLLIRDVIRNGDQIVIDREYPGYEKFINQKITELIVNNSKIDDIRVITQQIGKKSKAHDIAWEILTSKSRKNIQKLSSNKILEIIRANLKSGSI
ncbi:MAG TPA: hypothetical protein VJK26_02785 [Patescibacteria group bacterium]|nr:hypothetical protein [Patescibacteria group bacterium]